MIEDACPIPNKKQRTQLSPESSDNEELNLSTSFDEDYRILMNEEILKICQQPLNFNENFEFTEVFPNFQYRCDELYQWIDNILKNPRKKNKCRCDIHLEKYKKICCLKKLFESTRFTNIKLMANGVKSDQPHLAKDVENKLDELESVWQSKYLNLDIDLSIIIKDINADIDDLRNWLREINKQLNVQIDKQRMEHIISIENILNDFQVHDDINNSIAKTIEKVIQQDSTMTYKDTLSSCKFQLDELRLTIHSQWLNAMELKYRFESMANMIPMPHMCRNFGFSVLGQESGFESEISPMNLTRGLPINNLCVMKYISSSGEGIFDSNTTDFPMESESSDLSADNILDNKSISSSSSSIETMLEITPQSPIVKDDLHVHKKQKRFRKRRQISKTDFNGENLSLPESEKYLQIRNTFSRPSHSLKRRISEIRLIQELNKNDGTTSKISDLAAAAEKIVMRNDLNQRNNSFSESPKESEIEDNYNVIDCLTNDLNVKDVWDNYQASLYSNDDGDSQIVEVDHIRDWEQDLEIDNQENDVPLQIHTSGYETSMESDLHMCNKNLINVLKFSDSQLSDVNNGIYMITKQLKSPNAIQIDKINIAINEKLSISSINIELLDQILNNDPCGGSQTENLIEQILLLKGNWEVAIKNYLVLQSTCEPMFDNFQLDKFSDDIDKIAYYVAKFHPSNDLNDLNSTIHSLKEKELELLNINNKLTIIDSSNSKYILNSKIQPLFNRLKNMRKEIRCITKGYEKDFTIFNRCMEILKTCQQTRLHIATKLKGFTLLDNKDDSETLLNEMRCDIEKQIVSLETCLLNVSTVSSIKCSQNVKFHLEKEKMLLEELDNQLILTIPVIDTIRSKIVPFSDNTKLMQKPNAHSFAGFLKRLPVQMAIVVFIAMCGLWYKNQSSNSCQGSEDWLKVFRKYTNNVEPH